MESFASLLLMKCSMAWLAVSNVLC